MSTEGTVTALWRWPVIGLAGESVRSSRVGTKGMAGDRQHFLVGPDGPATAETVPRLARWRAGYPFNPDGSIDAEAVPPHPIMTAPSGMKQWRWGDPRMGHALERDLGVRLEPMRDELKVRPVVVAASTPGDPRTTGINVQLDMELPADGGWAGRQLEFASGVRLALVASRGDGPGIETRVVVAGRMAVGEAVILH